MARTLLLNKSLINSLAIDVWINFVLSDTDTILWYIICHWSYLTIRCCRAQSTIYQQSHRVVWQIHTGYIYTYRDAGHIWQYYTIRCLFESRRQLLFWHAIKQNICIIKRRKLRSIITFALCDDRALRITSAHCTMRSQYAYTFLSTVSLSYHDCHLGISLLFLVWKVVFSMPFPN